jgi:hypothetical protein
MKSLASLLSLLATLPSTFAIPDVTVEPLPNLCSSYPGWNADQMQAGPWLIQLSNSENTTMEGFSDTVAISRGQTQIRWGYVSCYAYEFYACGPLKMIPFKISD